MTVRLLPEAGPASEDPSPGLINAAALVMARGRLMETRAVWRGGTSCGLCNGSGRATGRGEQGRLSWDVLARGPGLASLHKTTGAGSLESAAHRCRRLPCPEPLSSGWCEQTPPTPPGVKELRPCGEGRTAGGSRQGTVGRPSSAGSLRAGTTSLLCKGETPIVFEFLMQVKRSEGPQLVPAQRGSLMVRCNRKGFFLSVPNSHLKGQLLGK